MHLNYTSFVLTIFFFQWLVFFLVLIDTFEERIVPWHCRIVNEWSDCSIIILCFSNLILNWVIFQLLLFLLGRKSWIYISVFLDFSFSFLIQWRLLEMNYFESWVYMQIGNLEFQVIFATFVHVAGFFDYRHLHILVNIHGLFVKFKSQYCHCLLSSLFSHLYFWYVYIFSLLICLWLSFFLCQQFFSFPFHRQYFSTNKLIFSNNFEIIFE